MTTATLPSNHRPSGLPMLLLIVGLLVLPFVIAAGLYFGGWQPTRTLQHGQLLTPPPALPASGLVDVSGRAVATAELHGKWLLVLSLDGSCAAECATRLEELRRIQVSLNKEMGRLRRVVFAPSTSDPALTDAARRQPDLLLFATPPQWLGAPAADGYRLHIVDPLGQRVIDYPAAVGGKELRFDLERLLKFAWTG
jgi:cytochrome oxidase Cu insertion factor (SCO1/SenC/PrrC family)